MFSLISKTFTKSAVLAITISITLINSCGTEHNNSESKSINLDELEAPLLLAFAGNATCPSTNNLEFSRLNKRPMYRNAFNLVNKIGHAINKKSEWIVGCFTVLGQLRYKTSDDPYTSYKASPNSFVKIVDNFWSRNPKRKGIVVGHSYGGWLSMKIAGELSHRKFHGIYTIDPVNPSYCRYLSPSRCLYAKPDIGFGANFAQSIADT